MLIPAHLLSTIAVLGSRLWQRYWHGEQPHCSISLLA